MESQAYFENIREYIQARLLTAKLEIADRQQYVF